MSGLSTGRVRDEEGRGFDRGTHHVGHTDADGRVAELERENARLHRLVAELLVKNQKLRGVE